MATASGTRPPTSGEISSTTQSEGVGDVPVADVVDWSQAILAIEPQPEEPPLEDPLLVRSDGPLADPPAVESPGSSGASPSVDDSVPLDTFPVAEASAQPPVARVESPAPPDTFRAVELSTPPFAPPRVKVSVPVVVFPAKVKVRAPRPAASEEADSTGASVDIDPAQITSHPSSTALPGAKTPPPETPLPVLLLVDQARSASGAERQELSRRINRWLDQMVREGGSRHVADWFHHLIESGRLEGLADAAGHSCHETAVRGLLAMGFPYALEVRPEDLERLQPRERSRKGKARLLKGAGAGVLAGGIVTELLLDLVRALPLRGLLTVEVGVSLLAMVALLVSGPRTPLRNLGLAVLLVASVLSIFLAFLGGYAGLASGLAGLVAVLLFALHRS